MKKKVGTISGIIITLSTFLLVNFNYLENIRQEENITSYSILEVPEYNNEDYVYINENIPSFTDEEKNLNSLENYSELDYLGRCGVAIALVSKETMPTKERESIGMIKPSGWHTIKYDNINGKYLYNRLSSNWISINWRKC